MNSYKLLYVFVTLCVIVLNVNCAVIESVDDNDLVHLIKGEESVVVLFTKNNCNECEKYEIVLEKLQEDLQQSLGAIVVKINNSPMVSIYDPTKEPSLLFFRRGIPLLYHGSVEQDEILQKFSDSRDPIVKELSDANFEHLTQASTGATTGDWFVFFYSSDCIMCQRLYAVWEAVGANLKRVMNVARMDRLKSGISTAKRFNVVSSPEFLYIRQGKFYRYKSNDDYTPAAFIKFIEENYHKVSPPTNVPPVASPVIDIYGSFMKLVDEYPSASFFGIIGFSLTAVIVVFVKFMALNKVQPTVKKTK